jgi:DNA invertase Pin-like site-specific DNA recombinase
MGSTPEMPAKRASQKPKSRRVFGHGPKTQIRAGLYARVSTHDQQTLRLQNRAMQDYAARRRDSDVNIVWRPDLWGRSIADHVTTLQELREIDVGFVSLTEALDLTTPSGRAMAGMLAVFAEFEKDILRERVRAGLAHARENGTRLGRPPTAALSAKPIRRLFRAGVSKAAIARQLQIGRTSVRRILAAKK